MIDIKQWALHDIEICSICFFQVLMFFFLFFENRTESSYEYPSTTQSPSSSQSGVMILYIFPTCNSTVPFIYLFYVLRIICLLCSIECLIKSYLRYKTILCHKAALDEEEISFSRYQDFCVFVNPADFKICDVIISIAT